MTRLLPRKVLLLLLALSTITSFAQTFRGTLSGTITDPSGAVIDDAAIVLSNSDTGFTQTVQSGKGGEFTFPELPVGIYTLAVNRSGFSAQRIDKIDVAVSRVTTINVTLSIGAESTTVDVTASGVTTDTTSSALVAVVNSQTVQDLPMNGRDFRQMIKLSPGVNIANSVNGARTNGINYQIDGADNNDAWSNNVATNQGGVSGISGTLVPIEAIDQFALQNNAEADMGRNGGANVNMVLKSGTNQFHGDLFYFNRNEFFASLSPVVLPNSRKPKIRNHQFGGTFGGPIFHDRTFFFITYEEQLAKANNNVLDTAPSTAWVNQATALIRANNLSVNQVSLNLLSLYPADATNAPATANNYLSQGQNTYNSYNGIIKLDHRFSDKYSISARYMGGTGKQTADVGSHFQDYFQTAPMHTHNFSVVQNSIFTSHLLNQITFAANYFFQSFNDANQNYDPAALGLNLGLTGQLAHGATRLNISGFDYTGATAPLSRVDVTGHVTDSLRYTIGKHELKFGGEYRHSNLNVAYFTNGRGNFTFDGTRGPWKTSNTLDALADFLIGQPSNSSGALILNGNPQRVYLVNSLDAWVHDDYRISKQLTINFGVRYTYPGVVHDQKDTLVNFIPGSGFQPSPLYNQDLKDIAPRVGFAYSLSEDAKTVIRGAYGWFYDVPTVGSFVYNSVGNGGATGIYSNPAGPAPVYGISAPSVTFQAGVNPFQNAAAPSSFGGFAIDKNFRTAYIQNFNLNLEQQLSKNTLFQIGYTGSLGRRLNIVYDINQPVNGVRPYATSNPNLVAINQLNNGGTSNYSALQTSIRQSNWHGITANINYTWGKAMDYVSSVTTPMNSYNLRADYGPSTFDIRNTLTGFVSYNVPQLGHRFPRLSSGWQLNNLFTFSGGQPINILVGSNVSASGENKDRPNYVTGVNPLSGRIQNQTSTGRYVQYLNSSAYSRPTAGTFGNLRRDAIYGPGLGSDDFSIFKNTKISERVTTQLRAEVLNIANQANYANPTATLSSSSFGQLTQTRNGSSAPGLGFGEPRNVQFALKVSF